jgi:ABC-type multidrug transport system fused ATPase/permease subunit
MLRYNVVLRYRAGLPAVLNNLSFTINSREKIGTVAGKSSLVTALPRLVELEEGCVLIEQGDMHSGTQYARWHSPLSQQGK